MSNDHDHSGAGICELCGRQVVDLTVHHLIPRTRHANKRNQKTFTRDDVKFRVANLCRPCHANVHEKLDNKVLERTYNTVPLLAAHPDVARFSTWIGKRPDGVSIPFATRKRR